MRTITLADIEKFFAKDALLIVNDKTIANNTQEFFETYERMDASKTRTFFILPVTEEIIKDDLAILRCNAELIKADDKKGDHKISGYLQFNNENRIIKFVEVFH
ncbi:hypothetical protein [Candidatus Odyssella thessalonicensis]|uniref:hypothetical protein n=1 Tax=Candidatus Odyssella thessalonicensis TaxID=84647 RepID=UPI000225BE8F|nr:hypothetical protein [Candidatus Odyssella thessalonicensis]